jgi:hypothetical protein
MKLHRRLPFFILLFISFNLGAQPLMSGWSRLLIGTWKVTKMDSSFMDKEIEMFLKFTPEKVFMQNPQRNLEAEWKVSEDKRQILIKTGENLEAWEVRFIDSLNLSIFDTVGFSTLSFQKYNGDLSFDENKLISLHKTDIIGIWLLLSIDEAPIPNNMNLTLNIEANNQLKIKAGKETKIFNWQFNESRTRLQLSNADKTLSIDWKFISMDSTHLSFIDKDRVMKFARYVSPLSSSQEMQLSSKWKIIEVAGTPANTNNRNRYLELNESGKLTFYTNDKKEGEGTWGIKSTKNAIFILSGGGTELWNILAFSPNEMLLEMGGVKMLLQR